MSKQSSKLYKCRACGHETHQTTNHHGPTWSFGRVNACPVCPPWRKYPEFGGQTVWDRQEQEVILNASAVAVV
jgi:hypothetical protein